MPVSFSLAEYEVFILTFKAHQQFRIWSSERSHISKRTCLGIRCRGSHFLRFVCWLYRWRISFIWLTSMDTWRRQGRKWYHTRHNGTDVNVVNVKSWLVWLWDKGRKSFFFSYAFVIWVSFHTGYNYFNDILTVVMLCIVSCLDCPVGRKAGYK